MRTHQVTNRFFLSRNILIDKEVKLISVIRLKTFYFFSNTIENDCRQIKEIILRISYIQTIENSVLTDVVVYLHF